MAAQYSPRGKRVTIVSWTDPADPHKLNVEAWAAAGDTARVSSHTNARQRCEELAAQGMVVVGRDTVLIR